MLQIYLQKFYVTNYCTLRSVSVKETYAQNFMWVQKAQKEQIAHRNMEEKIDIDQMSQNIIADEKTSRNQGYQINILGLSYGSLWRILHLDLHRLPYKVQFTQELVLTMEHAEDTQIVWLNNNPLMLNFLIDGTYFALCGYVYKPTGDYTRKHIRKGPSVNSKRILSDYFRRKIRDYNLYTSVI